MSRINAIILWSVIALIVGYALGWLTWGKKKTDTGAGAGTGTTPP